MERPQLSVCIPSYNRPDELEILLNSIDCDSRTIEIVIGEDRSPKRDEIRFRVNRFQSGSSYKVHYFENSENLGYDGNIRQLIQKANGKFILFMGDDDRFVPGALDRYLSFLKEHSEFNYILRSYRVIHPDGKIEDFKYYPEETVFPPGEKTVAWLFNRSVTICGFTISRAEAIKYTTTDLDGTLLYQVYLMGQVCLRFPSIYCDFPVAQAVQTYRKDKPMFGSSAAEKKRYTPGKVSEDNSINFTKAFLEVAEYLDRQNGTRITGYVQENLSKYSYPFLSIQRKRGISSYLRYAKRLEVECNFGCTPYYYIYKSGLLLLGERFCDKGIMLIKKILGYTPTI